MSKLFILGNGFDLASGLHTKYKDFREWFMKNHELDYDELDRIVEEESFTELEIPESFIDHHGEVIYDEEVLGKFFYTVVSSANVDDIEWNQFEKNLSRLPFYAFKDGCTYWNEEPFSVENEEENDEGYEKDEEFKWAYMAEQTGNNLADAFVEAVNHYFTKWIREVDRKAMPDTVQRIVCDYRAESRFLTFNYTGILEKFYRIPAAQICHIHGNAGTGDKIIVGHGEKMNDKDGTGTEDNFNPFDINDYVKNAKYMLKKPVERIISTHRDFFDGLGDLDEIFVIGWGLDEPDFVDAPYLQKVAEHADDNTILYFDAYNKSKLPLFMKTCSHNGYRGRYGLMIPSTGEKWVIP